MTPYYPPAPARTLQQTTVREADRTASLIRAEFAALRYASAGAISEAIVREVRDVPFCEDVLEEPRDPMRPRDAWGLIVLDVALWAVIIGSGYVAMGGGM